MLNGHLLSIAGFLSVFAIACATSHQNAWDESFRTQTPSDVSQKKQAELVTQAKAAWEERSDSTKALEAIEDWRGALEANPNDAASWADLSQALYFYADCHLRFSAGKDNSMERMYRQGVEAAERSLIARSPGFAERMRKGDRLESAVSMLDVNAAPALYWRAQNLDAWSGARGASTIFGYRGEVMAMLNRVEQLSPNYGFGGMERYQGIDAARGGFLLGGGAEEARKHFENANNTFPNYFKNKVVYAEHYAATSKDRQLYEDLLNQVASGDPEAMPGIASENRCEMRKAQQMLDGSKDLFD